jgi:hypothetical protein
MEIPGEQSWSRRQGSLISLVRELIASEESRKDRLLMSAFYDCLKERFYDRLRKAATRRYRGIPDWEGRMKEVFNDTFRIALEEIKTFELNDSWDEEECNKVILNWMSSIANNLLLKVARNSNKEIKTLAIYHGVQRYDLTPGQDVARKTCEQTYDREKFDAFWEKLNPMSRDILLACADLGTVKSESGNYITEHELGLLKLKNDLDNCAQTDKVRKILEGDNFTERNTDHLPDDVIEYLKKEYNVKAPAIRKAKQRALEGLRKCKL